MAKVLSSISGNLISAASAGFAPTNSADVSAIASAYQVVSATGTQLYVGTAYVTSVNSAPLSASRAGNAANASMATSAYYDGTGRLISSLPDSSAVSAIASAYATAKVDKSSISAQSSNWNSVYNTVSSNSASWSGSTGGSVTSPSGTIVVMDGNEIEGTNSAALTASGAGFEELLYAQNTHLGGYMQPLTYVTVPDTGATLMMPLSNPAYRNIQVTLSGRGAGYNYTSASGIIPLGAVTASIPMDGITGEISASADEWFDLANAQITAKKDGGILVTGVGELAWKSAVDNVTDTVSVNSASWGQGGVDSATVSAIASSYAESAASGKLDPSAQVVSATAGDGTYITSINGMGLSGQGGGSGTAQVWPTEIKSGDTSFATINTGFQDDITMRPMLAIGSTGYGRMSIMYFGPTGKSSTYLADAFEFYTGTKKVLRIDPTQISSKNYLLFGPSGSTTYGMLALGGSNSSAYVRIGSGNVEHKNYIRPSAISSWWNVYDHVNSASATWGGGGGASLPITGSAGSESATYGETSVEFNRYDTAGEPDIRTATLSPDALDITYTVDENDYYSVHINENGVEFSDPDGYYTVTPYDITNWNSAVETVANNSAAWGQGGVDSATVSAIASAYQVVSSTASGSGEIFGQTSYYATEINGLTLSAQEASLATYATNAGSAGAAPTNSSEVSAIASGYASGKADASALSSYALSADVSGVIDTVSANSASWTTDLTDYATTAYVDSSVSSKADSSSLSSYALSADVSGTVDVVSTQSANWGGSALALSAGPGVSLTKSGNTLIAGLDETVLWSGSIGPTNTAEMAYPLTAFERVRVTWFDWDSNGSYHIEEFAPLSPRYPLCGAWFGSPQGVLIFHLNMSADSTYTTISFTDGVFAATTGTSYNSATNSRITKIIGINRTAGV